MIVDDHPVVRKGIRSILETEQDIRVVGEAESAEEALPKIKSELPDLVLVDIELKGSVNGIELISQIRQHCAQVLSLVISMDDGSLYAERAVRAGARGYVAKDEASEKIVTAIRKVMSGEIYISDHLSGLIAARHITGKESTISLLSNRELDVFKLIGQGHKRSEICRITGLNKNTVESHRRNIREKLGLSTSSDLTRMAVEWYAENKTRNQE